MIVKVIDKNSAYKLVQYISNKHLQELCLIVERIGMQFICKYNSYDKKECLHAVDLYIDNVLTTTYFELSIQHAFFDVIDYIFNREN